MYYITNLNVHILHVMDCTSGSLRQHGQGQCSQDLCCVGIQNVLSASLHENAMLSCFEFVTSTPFGGNEVLFHHKYVGVWNKQIN